MPMATDHDLPGKLADQSGQAIGAPLVQPFHSHHAKAHRQAE
jgi:hypothetical protein